MMFSMELWMIHGEERKKAQRVGGLDTFCASYSFM